MKKFTVIVGATSVSARLMAMGAEEPVALAISAANLKATGEGEGQDGVSTVEGEERAAEGASGSEEDPGLPAPVTAVMNGTGPPQKSADEAAAEVPQKSADAELAADEEPAKPDDLLDETHSQPDDGPGTAEEDAAQQQTYMTKIINIVVDETGLPREILQDKLLPDIAAAWQKGLYLKSLEEKVSNGTMRKNLRKFLDATLMASLVMDGVAPFAAGPFAKDPSVVAAKTAFTGAVGLGTAYLRNREDAAQRAICGPRAQCIDDVNFSTKFEAQLEKLAPLLDAAALKAAAGAGNRVEKIMDTIQRELGEEEVREQLDDLSRLRRHLESVEEALNPVEENRMQQARQFLGAAKTPLFLTVLSVILSAHPTISYDGVRAFDDFPLHNALQSRGWLKESRPESLYTEVIPVNAVGDALVGHYARGHHAGDTWLCEQGLAMACWGNESAVLSVADVAPQEEVLDVVAVDEYPIVHKVMCLDAKDIFIAEGTNSDALAAYRAIPNFEQECQHALRDAAYYINASEHEGETFYDALEQNPLAGNASGEDVVAVADDTNATVFDEQYARQTYFGSIAVFGRQMSEYLDKKLCRGSRKCAIGVKVGSAFSALGMGGSALLYSNRAQRAADAPVVM